MNRLVCPAAVLFLFLCVASVNAFEASESPVIFDMDSVQHHPVEFTGPDNKKMSAGTAELTDGKFGKAVKFSFVDGARGGFMVARVIPSESWDKAGGFSFWVKGDGSEHWGGLELIDRDDFSLRYGYCFPINSTQWQKILVPWSDLTPEMTGPLVDAAHGYAPSHFGNFWFGKWFYWRDYAAHSYTIDQVQLEPSLRAPAAPNDDAIHGLTRLREKLKQHKPITIVTMGDSLTDKHHWSNQKSTWAELLAEKLKAQYGSDVKLVNPAVGGTTLSQNIVTMPIWSGPAPTPDLVTVWFGGNDWASGVRGERFGQYVRLAVDRIRRQTTGSADILLMTPCPSHENWETMKQLEAAVRSSAQDMGTGLADVATQFRSGRTADEAVSGNYLAWDKTHLGPAGHELACEVVLKAINDSK